MRKNWEEKKLGEVCDFQGGSQPPKSNFIYEQREGYVRFLQIRDFGSDKNITYIPESKKNKYCNQDDILLGRYGASVGKILVNKTGAYNVAVMKTIPNEKILNKRYLFFYLTSTEFQVRLSKVASRSAQDGFSKDDIFDFPILIPSITEQQSIVATLDEAFSAIAKAKANAEQNLKNAKELFESYLQGVFENKGEDWEEQNFEDCFKLKSGDGLTSKNMSEDGDFPVFGGNGIAGLHNKFNLSGSNVIIGRVGALCGNVRHITEKIWLTDNAFKVVDFKFEFDHSFLTYLLNYKNLRSFARQAAQPVISNSSLKDVVLEFPKALKTQQKIVQKLDALSEETKKLEAIYNQKINDLEELKKSVLQKAFSGELKTNAVLI
jgi:type I restriction enzyme S subunit